MAKVMVGIDFGTSNSGAIIGLYNNSDCSSFRTINHNLVDNYAKEPTYLLVKTDLLESDSNDNLIQNVKYELGNGNILFGQKAVEYCLENDSTEYVHFYDLKMNLYDDKNYVLGHIEGTEEGKEYDIVTIISIYISCLKTTVLDYLQTVPWGNVLEEDIKWAISIPAIWNDCAKKKMEDVCENVFGTTIVKVLEPEAACIYVLKTRDQETHAGEKYLVVDMGGGTTDIVGFELKEDASGDIYCEECVKHDGLPIAGRKIDKLFWQFFAEKLCNGIEKYNNWSPKVKYDKIIGSYFAHLDCKLEMEAYWETIKRCQDFVSDFEFDFKIPNGYIQWLDNNDFREIVDGLEKKSGRVVDYRLTLKSEEIRIRVYDPIKKEIIDIVKQKIEETTGNYNKIILTGGLSCNRYIQSEIRNALGDTVYYSYDDGASTNFKAGGAVLYGIPAMIIDGILMKRRSTLFYYVDVCIKTDTNTVKDDGLQFYFMRIRAN